MNSPSEQPTPRTDAYLKDARIFPKILEAIGNGLERELSRLRDTEHALKRELALRDARERELREELDRLRDDKCFFLTSKEKEAVAELCASQDLTDEGVMRQALRVYQLYTKFVPMDEPSLKGDLLNRQNILAQDNQSLRSLNAEQERSLEHLRSRLAAVEPAKAHVDACRVLLNVPDDEVLYSAIEDLLAERDALKDERDELIAQKITPSKLNTKYIKERDQALARLVSMEAERDEALKFNEQFSYDNLVASLTALQVAGMGQSGPNTLLAMVKECVARLVSTEAVVEKMGEALELVEQDHLFPFTVDHNVLLPMVQGLINSTPDQSLLGLMREEIEGLKELVAVYEDQLRNNGLL